MMKKIIDILKILSKSRRGRYVIILSVLLLIMAVLSVMLVAKRCSVSDVATQVQTTDPTIDSLVTEVPISGANSADNTKESGVERLERIMRGKPAEMLYGLPIDEMEISMGDVDKGETFSKLLNGKFSLPMSTVNDLVTKAKGKFDLRDLRAGNRYTAFISNDSTATLKYLVYDKNKTEYIIFDCSDKPSVKPVKRDITTVESYAEGVISSSLSATIESQRLPTELIYKLEDIFKWTIDFGALQKGDSFRVIYEEMVIDTIRYGVSKIYGAEFTHAGKPILSVSFEQDGDKGFWDQDGINLRKAFLRSPLSIRARVSSKFGMRIHPIKRTRGQHNGVDYACPSGTPVHAVANGTVIFKGWDRGGGGNMLKIKHDQGLISGYLHLKGFASGIKQGSRVSQSTVIGYVGSTGMSTGPHLDFRIWKGGKPVDPTKMQSLPSNPIKAGNKASFNQMKADVLKVMQEYKAQ